MGWPCGEYLVRRPSIRFSERIAPSPLYKCCISSRFECALTGQILTLERCRVWADLICPDSLRQRIVVRVN